ncbi:MAG: carboxypeptidase regulatory-like domain-containing protein [Acidobacteriaceae bacterium]|nr:carboxypeptidase regulatory-like domain-containing protein [Acidobacteriaceae bacterium]
MVRLRITGPSCLLLAAGLAQLLPAQTGTASLSGVVLDQSRADVAGARLTLRNTAQSLQRETDTNESGGYTFASLPPGAYTLTVEKPGFSKYEQNNLRLPVDSAVTSNVTLQIGSVNQQIEVNSQAVAINTTDASIGNTFNNNQIEELPLESRNVPDLLSLQTGVVYTGNRPDIDLNTDTRSGAVNGARSDQSNITLDGVQVNEKGGYAFQSVLPVTLDSVEEFRVTTTNYGAEQGGAGGAQVSLVTKSGTNSYHGSVYEYNRNSFSSANDYFVKAAQLESGQPNEPNFLNRNIFGGSLGGPIKKDRLFYFINYEGYRDVEDVSALRTVPSATLRDGIMQYVCQDPTQCPGGAVTGLSGKQYSYASGIMALSPQQLTAMDSGSLGPHGPDPAVINYMNTVYPLPNDFTTGDLLNSAGYRFRAPTTTDKNWYIAKLDYNITADGRHRLSVSGALSNEADAGAPFLPGSLPETTTVNYNKGIIANYEASLTPTLLNDFRYGFIRESIGTGGDSTQPWIDFPTFDQGITYGSSFQRPIHNFNDDFTWIHGKHTIQFGVQISLLRDHETNSNNSFSNGIANPEWTADSGFANKGVPLDPAANGYPAVAQGFNTDYDYPITALLGMVTLVNANYNYQRNGQPLSQGTPVSRNFAEDAYEMYVQDIWKIKPNFTATVGLRYSLFSPPWETNGLEVTPTINLGNWLTDRADAMREDIPSSALPLISYDWSGPANGGKPGYYNWDYHNFGPRASLAYSPGFDSGFLKTLFGGPDHTSIRAGFSVVYDRVGESIVDTFDQNGAFGLFTELTNPSAVQTSITAPRLTSLNTIPTTDYTGANIFIPAPPATFPQTYPTGLGAITWGIDQGLKTPYAYTLDFAISRQLPSRFSLDIAYVGRLSHRELAQEDLAEPLDIYDAKSGIDYFTAATALANVYRPQLAAGNTTPTSNFNPASLPQKVQQFWADTIQPLAPGGAYSIGACAKPGQTSTTSPVVAAFDLFCSTSLNESLALYELDEYGIPDANNPNRVYFPSTGQYTYYTPQFSSLYAWRSIANANYNALQVTLRRGNAHGLQFDVNYTFSKSIDLASDAERIAPASSSSALNNDIENTWNPKQERAVSSYDLTHQLNANWIYQLPFGRGKLLAGTAPRWLDAIIGGWQLSGLFRVTSGFPVNVDNGYSNYPTNFEQEGNATIVSQPVTGKYTVQSGPDAGAINIFQAGPAAINNFTYTLPGQSGDRNPIRGQGYFGIDMGLAKRWNMPWSEKQSLQLRWEVFNVTNSVRFDVQSSVTSGSLTMGNSTSFGNYTGLLTNPRIMQIAARYEF